MVNTEKINELFSFIRLHKNVEFLNLFMHVNDINVLNNSKQNLLQVAIVSKNDDIAVFTISKGIDVNNTDQKGQTSLHYCCDRNFVDICRAILKVKDVDVNIKDSYGNNPLWTAVFKARLLSKEIRYDILILLINAGANPFSINNAGRSPLSLAKQANCPDIVEILETSPIEP